MGTRGAYGVRVEGQDKIAYNHFDSYPAGLGRDLVKQLVELIETRGLVDVRELAKQLRAVNEDDPIDEITKARLGDKYTDAHVGNGPSTWYSFLRNLQGDIKATLTDARVYVDAYAFLADSLFCEWAYVINLDENVFEVYEGFAKRKHSKGRYATMERTDDKYHPVKLIKTFPIDASLPAAFEEFVAKQAEEEA